MGQRRARVPCRARTREQQAAAYGLDARGGADWVREPSQWRTAPYPLAQSRRGLRVGRARLIATASTRAARHARPHHPPGLASRLALHVRPPGPHLLLLGRRPDRDPHQLVLERRGVPLNF